MVCHAARKPSPVVAAASRCCAALDAPVDQDGRGALDGLGFERSVAGRGPLAVFQPVRECLGTADVLDPP
jgi:hypothetical protein